MADLKFIAETAKVALAAATPQTVLRVVAPANIRVKVLGWAVYFDGIDPAGIPVEVRVITGTAAGTFTNTLTETYTVYGGKSEINATANNVSSTAATTVTSEPTVLAVFDVATVHPQGKHEVYFPKDAMPVVAGGGFVAIECTAPAIVNVRAKLICEE